MSNLNQTCSNDALDYFNENIGLRGPITRVNALIVVNAILMGFMVGIGAYGHRYRHNPLIRFLFLAATILFLPIVSYIVSSSGLGIGKLTSILHYGELLIKGECYTGLHIIFILIWTGFVLIIGINTTALVAADAREGRSIHPNMTLLIQALWTCYLGIYTSKMFVLKSFGNLLLLGAVGFIFVKLLLKYYAWCIARKSLAFGRNPRLIVGYMEQLQDGGHIVMSESEHIPPPLIVTGEHNMQVQEKPCGYKFKWISSRVTGDMNSKGLVTFDKVWQLNDTLLRSKSLELKELCFSFALFKLLRCRIARYTITEVGFIKGSNFLRQMLLEDNDGERVFAAIAHELSFLHDYYYSPHPITYSRSWLPIVSIFISILSIFYSLVVLKDITIGVAIPLVNLTSHPEGQINCYISCIEISSDTSRSLSTRGGSSIISFGTLYFDIMPLYILAALVMLNEVRDIASYICSNWTIVALVCQYVKHGSRRQSATMQRCVSCVLWIKGKFTRNSEDKMSQSSILALHPRKTPMALLQRLHLAGQPKKTPSAVKSAIVGALRNSYKRGQISGHVPSFQRILHLQDDNKIIWTFGERGTTEIMLVCHIATAILGARSRPHQPPSNSDHMSAANHISQYCAYLVAHCPELLPEDDEWCKSLYKAIKKDAKRVLVGKKIRQSMTSELECQNWLIELLCAEGKHEVLLDGARLAERLVGLTEEEGEEMAWKALAVFWSEMILYVAPSHNIDGHLEAIARGGELITLVWALVTHLGIVGRSDDITDSATTIDV
ncbi:hypothetical protein CFC21_087164 [Triticum aestivum]|uniref:DUF4220 domain-containing protein n=3 Tax=Triticum TaxID=4564 RepID=A0A9R0YH32_TRITD|nr:hypothetical protein CFC21_087164 [Triticum aestivum]VAI54864.1 unnamed protein product [Triticum turgidum subsp. durum]